MRQLLLDRLAAGADALALGAERPHVGLPAVEKVVGQDQPAAIAEVDVDEDLAVGPAADARVAQAAGRPAGRLLRRKPLDHDGLAGSTVCEPVEGRRLIGRSHGLAGR